MAAPLAETMQKELIAQVERAKPDAELYWGPNAFNRPPQPEPFVSVLRRKK